jgi:3-hydroxybutyryl-CoA dehydratase
MITYNKGHVFKLLRIFSKDEVQLFSNLCGDKNPIHYDEEFCKNTKFKKPIIFGMLGASLFSNLLGNNLDGSVYVQQNLKFLRPIFIDEEVEASVIIDDLIKPKNYLLLKTKIRKTLTNELAIDGEAVVLYPKEKYKIVI